WFDYWVNERFNWYLSLGIKKENLRLREHDNKELAHYAKRTTDIEYLYPWGWGELEGIANRGSFDLKAHSESSGEDLSYFDEETESKITPSVIEPAGGLTRTFFAVMLDSYEEEQIDDDTRVVLKLDKRLAPIQVAVLPLSKKDPLIEVAEEINESLISTYSTEIDLTQSIGKRYRRQDEIGTPYCVTVDFESLEDKMVTIRDRDTMDQERVLISELREVLERKFN
ncbi:MAG: His/Gly/Thr/Pro-type tRNA ligase C-terminal domain-containing protein, partial [Actinomycetota bacterium]|nr:His/Gly/Thr/Pro-type tRNA ligase C-terminal domain-containing protein [Actinomycetota bacterium]